MVRSRLIALTLVTAIAPAWALDSLDRELGRNLFDRNWVSAPASTKADDGLGPFSDAGSCLACHLRVSSYQQPEERIAEGAIIRLGSAEGQGDPIYGLQLQRRASPGLLPEARVDIAWRQDSALRVPMLQFQELSFGAFAATTRYALRRPPRLEGVGVLARIPEAEILSRADADDANNDGISGRAAWIVDSSGKRALGRFGWRAGQATLLAQTEAAFALDLGMSTSGRPAPWGDCTMAQAYCRMAPHGAGPGEVEISNTIRDLTVAFLEATPAPISPEQKGREIFARVGCGACHATPRLGAGLSVNAYTDLLLHDLGPGLNDGIKEGAAEPGEWRTPPLWNMAATLRTGGLLHDGRALTVEEAIEWHDGEATGARTKARALNEAEKATLFAFINGL